jgi:hypothetical protein
MPPEARPIGPGVGTAEEAPPPKIPEKKSPMPDAPLPILDPISLRTLPTLEKTSFAEEPRSVNTSATPSLNSPSFVPISAKALAPSSVIASAAAVTDPSSLVTKRAPFLTVALSAPFLQIQINCQVLI